MIAKDKLYHFVAGALICLVLAWATGSVLLGFIAGAVAGVVKEAYDWWDTKKRLERGLTPRHSTEFDDFIATGIGAGFGMVLYMFLGYFNLGV